MNKFTNRLVEIQDQMITQIKEARKLQDDSSYDRNVVLFKLINANVVATSALLVLLAEYMEQNVEDQHG